MSELPLVVLAISIIALISSVRAGTCAPEKTQAPDVSLSKLVTIECVNVRLHTALDQLAESTGVAIRSGRDSRDWQVRDIPVTVCAKDIPLGKLLKSIAASTHLLLSKEQVGQITIYRIWRDAKRRKELDDFFKAKDAADLAGIAWDWDAVCKLKDAPASDDRGTEQDRNLGGILSSLGPDDKSTVMSGGYVKCSPANTAESARARMGNILQGLTTQFQPNVPPLTASDMQRSGMAIYLDRDALGRLHVWVSIGVDIVNSAGDIAKTFICKFPVVSDRAVKQNVVDGSERPAQPKTPTLRVPDGDWTELSDSKSWDMSMIQAKVSLEAPKDKDAITVGSLLAALSKASGLTIVCVDFASHRQVPSPARLFAKDTTVKAVLQALYSHSSTRLSRADFIWHANEKDKVILGTFENWPFYHVNLVSEGLLDHLMDKLSGDGVDLDDYLKVLALEKGQMEEWIKYSPGLQILDAYGQPPHKEFWALYDSLSPLRKARAQSDAGLPMANLQPAYVAYLISRYNQNEADQAHHHPLSKSEPTEFPYDDRSITSLVMKVKKKTGSQDRQSWSSGSGESQEGSTWPLGSFTVDTYEMTIEVTQNGETRTLSLGGPTGLPFRSPEREKALGIKLAKWPSVQRLLAWIMDATFPANRASNTWYSVDTNVDWRSVLRIIISIILIVFSASTCVALDVDGAKDQRLAQPVTIECVNVRLHVVLAQLDEKTGVAIRCGRDARDSQVRDIPVTVCAKDMPLGKLLKSIAASTHLLLSKDQVGQTIIYRIWRDAKRRKQIDEFLAAEEASEGAACRAALEWEWDAASALKDSDSHPDGERMLGKGIAGLLAALGPGAKEQVISGGYIQYLPGTVPASLRPYMELISGKFWAMMEPPEKPLTPEDMRGCGFLINIRDRDGTPHVNVEVGIAHAAGRDINGIWNFGLGRPAKSTLSQDTADTVKTPDEPDVPAWESPGGDWAELTDQTAWDLPILRAKISLDEPKDKKPVTCGSALAALSKASGFAVMIEDFESHRKQLASASLLKKDATIKDILAELDHKSDTKNQSGLVWHINEKEKLIIGTSDDWPVHHRNVAPEALLVYLKAKLNGDGVDLDDFLKVVALEPGQQEEWVFSSPDLAVLNANGMPFAKDLWLLYDSLSAQQKAQAQTEAGLPMAGIHPAYVAYLVNRQNEYNLNDQISPLRDPREAQWLIRHDEQSACGLVMRINKRLSPRFGSAGDGSKVEESPDTPMVTQYLMRLYITQNGKTRGLVDNGGVKGVPIYSPERLAALGIKPAN